VLSFAGVLATLAVALLCASRTHDHALTAAYGVLDGRVAVHAQPHATARSHAMRSQAQGKARPWMASCALPRHARCVKPAINLLSLVCRCLPDRPSCRECVLACASLQPLAACLALLRFLSPLINPLLLYFAL
jgi:hypothetical protein